MKFLIDAQLPRKLVRWLSEAGHDAIHTFDLPEGNASTDMQVIAHADAGRMVLVTKDADFVNEHMLNGRPAKLLLVSAGNMSNQALLSHLIPLIPSLVRELEVNDFLELSRDGIVVRG